MTDEMSSALADFPHGVDLQIDQIRLQQEKEAKAAAQNTTSSSTPAPQDGVCDFHSEPK